MRDSQPSAATRGALAALLALLLLGLGTADATGAPDAHDLYQGFTPTGKYVLYVSGKLDAGADIYHSRRAAAYLVLGSRYGGPLLITPRGGGVHTFDRDALLEQEDGSIALAQQVELDMLGRFRLEGRDVLINIESFVARLQPRPHLVGQTSAAEILEHSPEHGRTAYRLDESVVGRLRREDDKVEVKIVFGTWCPTCKHYLPRILKLEEALAESKIHFVYYGLPQPPEAWTHPAFTEPGLAGIPTALVRVDGREVGRIEASEWERPEATLERILR